MRNPRHFPRAPGAVLVLGILLSLGCRGSVPAAKVPAGPAWFEDITESVGLAFTHDAGPVNDRYFLPQILGSGAALFDCDGDGRLDIYLLQNGGPGGAKNRLFRQGKDGRFTDVSAGSGLDIAGYNMGAAVGDVNNDGRPDVVVTQWHGLKLFLNNGDGTFTDVTRPAGLDHLLWGTSCCFVDYDRDGWLDLVVVNYVDYDPALRCGDGAGRPIYCHPSNFRGSVAKLFRNRGPAGADSHAVTFEDVTLKSGLGRQPGPGLGVAAADFDGDGWPDLFVANDDKPNHLWLNQRDGTFRESALLAGVACNALGTPEGNMGVALGDVDGDGLFDLFVTHLTEERHTLWRQGPPGLFQDRTAAAGLAASRQHGTGFGTVLADFDHDGALDLAIVNGRVAHGRTALNDRLTPFWRDYAEPNELFANDGAGRFRDIAADNGPFCGTPNVARGLACGDVDGDGALDLLVTTVAGPARLYRNVAPKRGHWLLVRAFDPARKRDAYGAAVTVEAGPVRKTGWVNPGQSYLCSHDPRAHFGLGPADRVDAFRVRWPDGAAETFPGGPADRAVVLRKGEGVKN